MNKQTENNGLCLISPYQRGEVLSPLPKIPLYSEGFKEKINIKHASQYCVHCDGYKQVADIGMMPSKA